MPAFSRNLPRDRETDATIGDEMPNYARQEQDLLTETERALSGNSRQPALGALDDAALMGLIAALETARGTASEQMAAGGLSAAGLLDNALKRAHAERRKRKLNTDGSPREAAAATGTAAKPAKRAPAGSRRVPSDRKTADPRKSDLRTGSRRVKKAPAAPRAVEQAEGNAVPAPEAPAPVPAAAEAAASAPESAKQARKTRRQAEKAAAKAAEKEARKAARKAEKEAEKAARKAAKKAARKAANDADRALRKQEEKLDKKAGKKEKAGKKKAK